MRILGIDPGTRITGYGIVEKGAGNKLIYVSSGSITTRAGSALSERLLVIATELDSIIEEFKPEAAAIESVFHAKNVKSAITLGHARGVAFLSAARGGLEVFEYAPTMIKQAVTGFGTATKDQMQKMVRVLLKIDRAPKPDAADALGAAVCHINNTGPLTALASRRGSGGSKKVRVAPKSA